MPTEDGGRGWVTRYPPHAFSVALDLAMREVADLTWDLIATHPRFVDPEPPPATG